MIPHSKKYLEKKYGGNIIGDSHNKGASTAFSYVIYSRNASEKFIKQTKKLHKVKREGDADSDKEVPVIKRSKMARSKAEEHYSSEDNEREAALANSKGKNKDLEYYYKYLKALSSKVTSISLTFTKAEFMEIVKNKKYNINLNESAEEFKEMD